MKGFAILGRFKKTSGECERSGSFYRLLHSLLLRQTIWLQQSENEWLGRTAFLTRPVPVTSVGRSFKPQACFRDKATPRRTPHVPCNWMEVCCEQASNFKGHDDQISRTLWTIEMPSPCPVLWSVPGCQGKSFEPRTDVHRAE